jgi:two-component system, NtrC family, response regulator AtoC
MSRRILVVDDDESHRKTLARFLTNQECEILAVESAERALGALASFDPHLIITDIKMPGMSGFEFLRHIRSVGDDRDVVMITAFEDMKTAVEAMKEGAYDFLVKPLDLDQVEAVVARCFKDRSYRRRAQQLAEEAAGAATLETLVGRDPRMIEIYKLIGKVSQTHTPVLIRGETGTGKELIARAIHFNSPEGTEPFVAVNCTALPETLLESELFGHVKGAFTGAIAERRGRFELAGSGTIFLDEIGDTSAAFQGELLRVLQEGEYHPLGAERARHTDARVIAATHRPIEQMVKEGDFREDLYFRLRVVEVIVPPLRDRRSDIPVLAQHIVNKVSKRLHKGVYVIPDPVMAELMAYDWPGNVRELENALTRAIVLAQGPAIAAEDLVLGAREMASRGLEDMDDATLAAVEGAHVQRVLARTGGNKTRAAEILGISRPRLDRIIERHALFVP